MKKKKDNNIVTKIALVVAIIALVFSIVTLVHIIDTKGNILLGWIQVIGTAIIVVICSMMLYVLSTNDNIDEDDEDEDEDEEETPAEKKTKKKTEEIAEETVDEKDDDIDIDLGDIAKVGDIDDEEYDLTNFE